ncbi:MAG: SRPBCC family protein [Enhygromyxa sp.]
MSRIKKIALGVAGVLGLFVVIVLLLAATKPDQIHIERSLVMRGAPADVFPYANDFKKFTTWIPWTQMDPDQKLEYSEPSSGVGAWYSWVGNEEVGRGRMELLSSAPDKVVHKLEFIEPFESVAEASLIMKAVGEDQVEVTWALDQQADFGTKIMCVFMDMDSMVGPDFERGLARLQPLVEADAKARAGG